MTARKKFVNVLAGIELVLAVLILASPKTLFPLCESHTGHCRYSFQAEAGIASAVIAAALCIFFSKTAEAPRLLSVVTAVCGIYAVLIPSYLIGVCGSPEMPCHFGLLPVWNLSGGFITFFSIIIFFASREEPV